MSEQRLIDANALKATISNRAKNIIAVRSDGKCFFTLDEILRLIDNAPTVADRYDEGFRDGYAKCINDREEKKEHNRLFGKAVQNE